jgi:uncharacterized protein YaeQ
VALTATIYTFEVELADVDRGVYQSLALRAARQPSETAEYLLTRVLAYCLEYVEGIGFSRGLAEPDEPTLAVRDCRCSVILSSINCSVILSAPLASGFFLLLFSERVI